MASTRGGARALLAFAIVAVLGMGLGVATTLRHRQQSGTATNPVELVRLLDGGQQQTYHAHYTAVAPAGNLDIELWRQPPRFRERVDASGAGLAARTDTLIGGSDATVCTQLATSAWMCTPSPEVNVADADAVAAATRGLSGQQVVKRLTRIAGMKAVCYTLSSPGGPASDVCATLDGIPLRVTSAAFRFEIASLQRSVDPAAFVSPAG